MSQDDITAEQQDRLLLVRVLSASNQERKASREVLIRSGIDPEVARRIIRRAYLCGWRDAMLVAEPIRAVWPDNSPLSFESLELPTSINEESPEDTSPE